ncbi:hypothetical protein GPALN_003269 [Globodera pallida]|nr:hypothetical protein GPALN_003269 [Globodera pallida]
MSDNKSDEKQQQQMKEIFNGVFAFLDPFELGLKMALISDRLDVLVDVHFKSRKWSLDWLVIRRAIGGNGAEIVNFGSYEVLPIPQEPLPKNVIGFEWIEISYVDQTVIEFIQRIRPLFDSTGTTVTIDTYGYESRSWEIICQKIWPFVNDNIRGLLLGSSQLDRLRQFSPAILRNCPNLRSIESCWLFPAFPADDNAEASSAQALAKWLLTPRGDGRPKILHCLYSERIEGVKGSFRDASKPANFIIIIQNDEDEDVVPFTENNWTGERLSLRQIDEDKWLLVRCPIGREEDKWTNWEKEAIEWDWNNQWNRIFINFEDGDIGDGMDEANEGPNEPTG